MPLNNNVTRFSGGVNTLLDSDPLANLGIIDPTRFHQFLAEFDTYLATNWTVGGLNAGAKALASGNGGILSMTNGAADNDNSYISGQIACFTFVAGKRLFFRARANCADVTQSDIVLGLQVAVAANEILIPVDGVFFRKDDGAATIALVNRAASVETASAALGTLVNSQQFEVAFAYDGVSSVLVAALQVNTANGPPTVVGSITPAALPTVALLPMAGIQNGEAVAKILLLDTLYCIRER